MAMPLSVALIAILPNPYVLGIIFIMAGFVSFIAGWICTIRDERQNQLWDIIDAKTRFSMANHMFYNRTKQDAQFLMQRAYDRTGKIPRGNYADYPKAYLDGIELTFGAETKDEPGSPFDVECKTN